MLATGEAMTSSQIRLDLLGGSVVIPRRKGRCPLTCTRIAPAMSLGRRSAASCLAGPERCLPSSVRQAHFASR